MSQWLYQKSNGQLIMGGMFYVTPPGDDFETYGVLQLADDAIISLRLQRWDGADGLRDATASEIAAFDSVAQSDAASAKIAEPVTAALLDVLADLITIPVEDASTISRGTQSRTIGRAKTANELRTRVLDGLRKRKV